MSGCAVGMMQCMLRLSSVGEGTDPCGSPFV